jgi:outer membrane protease
MKHIKAKVITVGSSRIWKKLHMRFSLMKIPSKSIVGHEGESWSSMLIMTKKAKEKFKQAIEEGKKFRQVIKETTKYMLLKGDINQDIVSQATLSDAEIKSLKGVIVMKEKGKSTQKNFHKK